MDLRAIGSRYVSLPSLAKITGKKIANTEKSKIFGHSSTVATFVTELRCVKHSPRIKVKKVDPLAVEKHEFENVSRQQTFDAMGRLKKLKLKELKPFTTLNEAPYHCSCLARTFNVRYGKLSQVEGASVKSAVKKGKEVKLSSFCKCTEPIISSMRRSIVQKKEPAILQRLEFLRKKDIEQEILNHSLLVWWNADKYNKEEVYEWLQRFGTFLFTYYAARSTLVVFFDSMKNAHRAVNCPLVSASIRISWYDVRHYNYGYYRRYENDVLSKNPAFVRFLSRKFKSGSANEGKSTSQKLLPPEKKSHFLKFFTRDKNVYDYL